MADKNLTVWWRRGGWGVDPETEIKVSTPEEAVKHLKRLATKDLANDSVEWNAGGLLDVDGDEWYSLSGETEGMDIREYEDWLDEQEPTPTPDEPTNNGAASLKDFDEPATQNLDASDEIHSAPQPAPDANASADSGETFAPAMNCPECGTGCKCVDTYQSRQWGLTHTYKCPQCGLTFDQSFPEPEPDYDKLLSEYDAKIAREEAQSLYNSDSGVDADDYRAYIDANAPELVATPAAQPTSAQAGGDAVERDEFKSLVERAVGELLDTDEKYIRAHGYKKWEREIAGMDGSMFDVDDKDARIAALEAELATARAALEAKDATIRGLRKTLSYVEGLLEEEKRKHN